MNKNFRLIKELIIMFAMCYRYFLLLLTGLIFILPSFHEKAFADRAAIYNRCVFKEETIPVYNVRDNEGSMVIDEEETRKKKNSSSVPQDSVFVRPVGRQCYEKCQRSCALTFGLIGEEENDKATQDLYDRLDKLSASTDESENSEYLKKDMDLYLNRGQISKCLQYCAAGERFTGYRVEFNGDDGQNTTMFDSKVNVENNTVCNKTGEGSAAFPYYLGKLDSDKYYDITVYEGFEAEEDILRESVSDTIYKCGYKDLYIYPESTISGARNGNIGGMDDRDYWHSRSWVTYYDLGKKIYFNKGDSVQIKYFGRYRHDRNSYSAREDYDLLVSKWPTPESFLLLGASYRAAASEFAKYIDFTPSDKLTDKESMSSISIANPVIKGTLSMSGITQPKAFLQDKYLESIVKNSSNYMYCTGTKVSGRAGAGCVRDNSYSFGYNKATFPQFSLQGETLENGLALGFRNKDNSAGGYNLDLSWKGCKIADPHSVLEYTVIPTPKNIMEKYPEDTFEFKSYISEALSSAKWSKLTEGMRLEDKSGRLYVRIPPLFYKYESAVKENILRTFGISDDSKISDNHRAALGIGGFEVGIKRPINESSGVFCDVIGEFKDTLFGSDRRSGLVGDVYNGIVGDAIFITVVKLILVIFVSYTAAAYMLGISQINQKEAMLKILKLSIVTALISKGSWTFFYDHLLGIFINGVDGLINTFSYGDGLNSCSAGGPNMLFRLNGYIKEIWTSDTLWPKFWALFFSGIGGFITSIVMFLAIIIYTLCLIRAFIVYLMSLVSIAVMVILAPVMIPMILFGFTKKIFDAWIKQFFLLVIQTIAIFAVISLFLGVIELLFQAALHFTVCKSCLLSFMGWFCLIEYWVPMQSSHYSYDSITFIGEMLPSICLLFVCQIMLSATSGISSIMSRIISFGAMSLNSSMTQFAAPVTNAAKAVRPASMGKAASKSNMVDSKKNSEVKKRDS